VAASRAEAGAIALRWTIAPGNYLYRESLKATINGRDIALTTPAGEEKDDPTFGRVEVYHQQADAMAAGLPGSGALQLTYQGCAEKGICYPPLTKAIDLATLAVSDVGRDIIGQIQFRSETPAPERDNVSPLKAPQESAQKSAQESTDDIAASFLKGDLGWMLAAFLGFGLLLSLTPCIFPMIPILSGIVAGSGGKLTTLRGFVLSSSYVLAMAAAYGAMGLAAGWSGQNLQAALQTSWALLLMAAVFVALALSMFGLFELQLPARLAVRLSGGSARGGSLGGAVFLGFGSALIVGPCVTPPLAAAMIYAAQSGEAGRGALALFALGLGMGLPLIAFGTFGARILPKSGPWLSQVKQVFGFVFLIVAAMLVARLLPEPATLALWGVVTIGAGVFLGGFDRLTVASGWGARLGKTAGLAVSIYGAALIVGFAGGAGDPMRPLAFLASSASNVAASSPEIKVTSLPTFDQALASAAPSGRPVLVSFTADWCTVCKSNEAVFDDPAIRHRLDRLTMISADVTTYNDNAKALMGRFSVVGPPTLFLLNTEGEEIPRSRIIGAITKDDVIRRLSLAGK
jgi:thiol:disulfide interchange protein DsbD